MSWDELNVQYEAAHELAEIYQKRGDHVKFWHWYSIARDFMYAKWQML